MDKHVNPDGVDGEAPAPAAEGGVAEMEAALAGLHDALDQFADRSDAALAKIKQGRP